MPAPGSAAARQVGGPLMASTGTVVAERARRPEAAQGPGVGLGDRERRHRSGARRQGPARRVRPGQHAQGAHRDHADPQAESGGHDPGDEARDLVEPNVAGLITGRAYQVASLFKALLLISANDAAVALTEATGSFAKGMALINAEARHLQAYDVVAKLPNGLPAPGQVESAYDEALIARQALAMPAFMRYDETLTSKFEVKPQ